MATILTTFFCDSLGVEPIDEEFLNDSNAKASRGHDLGIERLWRRSRKCALGRILIVSDRLMPPISQMTFNIRTSTGRIYLSLFYNVHSKSHTFIQKATAGLAVKNSPAPILLKLRPIKSTKITKVQILLHYYQSMKN